LVCWVAGLRGGEGGGMMESLRERVGAVVVAMLDIDVERFMV